MAFPKSSALPGLPQKTASPMAAPIPLPSIAPSLLSTLQTAVAGPSSKPAFKPTSKPVSTAPVDIDPQSQRHADTLRRFSIKVRDFAYESNLPPVKGYYRLQIQPSVPKKRTRKDGEDEDVSSVDSSGASLKKKAKLEREDTEPNIQLPTLNRARGFMNLDDYAPEPLSQSQESGWEASQHPSKVFESQGSEPYIDTPLVTPNGSLQWRIENTSDIPASQLDTESQAHDSELSSCSQLDMPEPARDTTGTGLFGALTPMSSLSSIISEVSTKPLPKSLYPQPYTYTHAPITGSPLRAASQNAPSPAQAKTPTPPPPSSRYTLRRRAPPKSPIKAGPRTRRAMYAAAQPISRPIVYSTQSSHSEKTQRASSSTRTMRTRGVSGPSGRDDAMVVR